LKNEEKERIKKPRTHDIESENLIKASTVQIEIWPNLNEYTDVSLEAFRKASSKNKSLQE
jgi:hypothetical protein